MLELIMVLSAVLGKYANLAVVSALLGVNAVLSFAQERRAAGVVETLRRRWQVNARVRRDASWQVIPARELVPGDIVRVRQGDIILCLGGRVVGFLLAWEIIRAYLAAHYAKAKRFERRLAKVAAIKCKEQIK